MNRTALYIIKLMQKTRRGLALLFASALAIPALAGYAPQSVKESFETLYPNIEIEKVIWSNEDEGYFIAKFLYDGFATKAWFNEEAQCIMVQTDIETMDRVTDDVYNAFAAGDFGNYTVRDVTYVVFPHWQPMYVILIGEPNLEESYQLFYTPFGELINHRSTAGIEEPLGLETFFK
jgi:hypothetical protein